MGVKVYGGIDKIFKYEDNIGVIIINNIDYEDGKCWVDNKKNVFEWFWILRIFILYNFIFV